jgi:broad specificity phosphatase PhoE
LIVSHAVVIQSIIVKNIIDDIDKYWNITIDNCSLSTIVMDEENIYLKELNSK